MIARIFWLVLMAALAAIAFYISRFWDFRLWGRDELFGLRPQGGYVGQWLRGTDAAPFELLVWVIGGFAILTILQKIYDLFNRPPTDGDTHD